MNTDRETARNSLLELSGIENANGYSVCVKIPNEMKRTNSEERMFVLLEAGQPIGGFTKGLRDVERLGEGRFHINNSTLYFSSSDNSDINTNGRKYHLLFLPNIISHLATRGKEHSGQKFNPLQSVLAHSITESRPVEWSNDLIGAFWSEVSISPMAAVNFSKINGKRLLDIVREHLQPDLRCLDFGAGDGDLVRELLEQGFQCGAYEVAAGRASKIHELAGKEGFLGVFTGQQETEFDVLFMLDVIEHILPDQLAATLDLLLSLLKVGGKLIISTPNLENLEENYCICPVCRSSFHRWQHLRAVDAGYLESLFQKWGCKKIATHRVDFSHDISDEEVRKIVCSAHITAGDAENPSVAGIHGDFRFGSQSHLIYVGEKFVCTG